MDALSYYANRYQEIVDQNDLGITIEILQFIQDEYGPEHFQLRLSSDDWHYADNFKEVKDITNFVHGLWKATESVLANT